MRGVRGTLKEMTAKIIFFLAVILLLSICIIPYAKGEGSTQTPQITKKPKPPKPIAGPIPHENCEGATCARRDHSHDHTNDKKNNDKDNKDIKDKAKTINKLFRSKPEGTSDLQNVPVIAKLTGAATTGFNETFWNATVPYCWYVVNLPPCYDTLNNVLKR